MIITNEISKKLDNFFNEKGLSSYKVAQITKISEPSIGRYRSGKSKPSGTKLAVLLKSFPDLQSYLTGTGSMLNDEPEQSEKEDTGKVSYDVSVGRPFYNIEFGLGFSEDEEIGALNPEFYINFPPANKKNVQWYSARGNSMLGEINSGDYVAFEKIDDFSWFPLGKIYGIVTKNGMRTVKRITKSSIKDNYLLISSNPDKINNPDQELPKNIISQLFKVVFVIKNLEY